MTLGFLIFWVRGIGSQRDSLFPFKAKIHSINVMEKLCLKNTISILHISFGIRYPNLKSLCLRNTNFFLKKKRKKRKRNTILVLNIGYTKIVGVFDRVA